MSHCRLEQVILPPGAGMRATTGPLLSITSLTLSRKPIGAGRTRDVAVLPHRRTDVRSLDRANHQPICGVGGDQREPAVLTVAAASADDAAAVQARVGRVAPCVAADAGAAVCCRCRCDEQAHRSQDSLTELTSRSWAYPQNAKGE